MTLTLITLMLVSIGVVGLADIPTQEPRLEITSQRCVEDDPCFTWSTMGNHRRGVRTLDGRKLVVGVCRFKRLAAAGRLAYWPMRGDIPAIQREC